MPKLHNFLRIAAFVCLSLAATALPADQIPANRTPAGKLENSVLDVQLEIRTGGWHPEAAGGPELYVQAFGEREHPAQIPGPLLRISEGTAVQAMRRLDVALLLHCAPTSAAATAVGHHPGLFDTCFYSSRQSDPEF